MKQRAFVPIVTYPDAPSENIAAGAAAVTASLGADLHAAVFNVDVPDISHAFSRLLLDVPKLVRDAEEQSRRDGDRLLASIKSEAMKRSVIVTTNLLRKGPAFLAEAAAAEARYYDIPIVGCETDNTTTRTTAEAVLFGSGRPTLLLPPDRQIGSLDHVVIAWDASRASARAVADAGPFLARASEVTVVTVTDEKPLENKDIAERLANGLRKRTLPARARTIETGRNPIGVTLQEFAGKIGGGLLVMGGYGHSAIREFVLGGATKAVLDDLRLPALLSH
jgi:nucleotide-binding universal stress UspA family protein